MSAVRHREPATDRVTAVARLGAAVERIALLLESMPPPPLTGGEWGPREILCHLVYWHEHYVSIVHAMNSGRAPALPVGVFPEFNAESVRLLGQEPVSELIQRLRLAQRRLGVELLGLPGTARIRIKVGSKARGPVEFATAVEGHLRGHAGDVRQWARRQHISALR